MSCDVPWLGFLFFLVDFHFMIVLWCACFTTVTLTFFYVLVCSDIALGGYKSMHHQEHHFLSMWVHENGQSCQTYDEVRADFAMALE
jgi:hypothetical protein